MQQARTLRGAWRRTPALPRAMAAPRGLAATAPAPRAEASEGRRGADRLGAGRAAPYAPGFDVTPGEEPVAEAEVRTGGCLCGAVRYELRGAPKLVGLCHCADCRKATGGFAMPYADWPNEAVTIAGPLATYKGRSFCPECGSRVVHPNAHHAEVMLGTLDDPPTDLVPQREIWTIRREPWMAPVPGATQFERDGD